MQRLPTGTVAFLFTDIEGSTALWATSEAEMGAALEEHDSIVHAASGANDGHIFSTRGDGFGIAFDRVDQAIDTAHSIQRALGNSTGVGVQIKVRSGVHIGEAHEREGNYFGPAVNLTARVADAGVGGQVLITPQALMLSSADHMRSVDLGEHLLKGLAEPQRLYDISMDGVRRGSEILRVDNTRQQTNSERRTALSERDDELAAMLGLFEDAARGHGSLLFVEGEAGAGKTSLVNEFLWQVRGASVLRGGCDPLSTPRPFGPLRDMASDPGSPFAELLDGQRDALSLGEELLRGIRDNLDTSVLVFEDIHWADEATVELLHFVGRRVAQQSMLVVCTYRSNEVADTHPVRSLAGDLITLPNVQRLELAPLTLAAVAGLVASSALDAQTVYDVTRGNPFYVTEVLAAGSLLPGSVRDAVLSRLGRLDEPLQAVLKVVSLAPREMEFDLLAQLLDVDAEQIDEAVGTGMLLLHRNSLRFRHDLARSAVQSSIAPSQLLDLHGRIAMQLRSAPRHDHARIAHHALASTKADLILELVPDAARHALAHGSHVEAVELMAAAVECAAVTDVSKERELRTELILPFHAMGRFRESLSHAEAALAATPGIEAPSLRATILIRYARVLISVPNIAHARQCLSEAAELLAEGDPTPERWECFFASSMLHMLNRRHQPAIDDLERCAAIASELNVPGLTRRTEAHRSTIEMATGNAERAVELLVAAANEARTASDHIQLEHTLGMLGSGAGERRIYTAARPALDEAVALSEQMDRFAMASYNRSWIARVAFERGRYGSAERLAREVIATAPSPSSSTMMTAQGTLGRSLVRRGDADGVELLAAINENFAATHFLQYVWSPVCGLAEHRWLSGDRDAIPDIVGPLYKRALESDSEWAKGELAYWMWRAGQLDTPPPSAAAPFALQMQGQWEEAAAQWEILGCPYEQAMALGDGPPDACAQAVQILEGLGSAPAARLVQECMASERNTAGAQKNPADLTRRQLEVLALAAEGLSNGEIADQIYVSKKTVEHHISAIFSKLGVTSRTAAVAAGRQIGAIEK